VGLGELLVRHGQWCITAMAQCGRLSSKTHRVGHGSGQESMDEQLGKGRGSWTRRGFYKLGKEAKRYRRRDGH
jgi:hypothetical protein